MPVLVLAGLVFHAGPAWAAEEGILEPRYDLGIWTIVVFVLLFLVLRRYAWGPMLQGLQKREENIQHALDEARQAHEDAQRLRDQLQAEVNRAHEKVRDIVEEGRRAAERTTADMMAKTRAEMQAERERLHREINMARDQALQELWNQSAQLASMIAAKAIRRQLSMDDHRHLVDEALGELRQAGEDWKRQVRV
jgi:F-type H+-transporting ATPase subunit b